MLLYVAPGRGGRVSKREGLGLGKGEGDEGVRAGTEGRIGRGVKGGKREGDGKRRERRLD
jgi:hypothetical protein